ncbi:MAG: barstar family protein [Saprospiraceae bacterium]|nr:barstar family protein [Saprospiraceae bacterium]
MSQPFFHLLRPGQIPDASPSGAAFLANIDGSCCKTMADLYSSLALKLSFPEYFGNNLDALYDVLLDLSWIEQDRVIIFIDHFEKLLSESPETLPEFLCVLRDACVSREEPSQWPAKHLEICIRPLDSASCTLNALDIPYDLLPESGSAPAGNNGL